MLELDLNGLHEAIERQHEFIEFTQSDEEYGLSPQELEPHRRMLFFLCQHRDLINWLLENQIITPDEKAVIEA